MTKIDSVMSFPFCMRIQRNPVKDETVHERWPVVQQTNALYTTLPCCWCITVGAQEFLDAGLGFVNQPEKTNDKSIVIGWNLLPLHGTSVLCFNICTGIAFAKIWTLIASFEKKTNQLIPGSFRSMPRFWDTWSWLLKAVVKSLWKWSSLIWNQVAGWAMPFSFFHPCVLDRHFFLQEKIRTICTMLQKNWSAWPRRPLTADHCCPLVRDLEN